MESPYAIFGVDWDHEPARTIPCCICNMELSERVLGFMERLDDFRAEHWDHEPLAFPRRTKSADKSDALQTLRARGRVSGGRVSVWSACVFSAAFPKQAAIRWPGRFMEVRPSGLVTLPRHGLTNVAARSPIDSCARWCSANRGGRSVNPICRCLSRNAVRFWSGCAPARCAGPTCTFSTANWLGRNSRLCRDMKSSVKWSNAVKARNGLRPARASAFRGWVGLVANAPSDEPAGRIFAHTPALPVTRSMAGPRPSTP